MPQTKTELPTVTDAQEWRYHAQQNDHAAVQLAQNMAIDYGKKLVIHRHPSVELRYEGRGFGKDKEPPCLFYARHIANDSLSLERVITRMLEQCGVYPATAADLIPAADPETEPPVTTNGCLAGL